MKLWIIVIAVAAILGYMLLRYNPSALSSEQSKADAVQSIAILALLLSALGFRYRGRLGDAGKHIVIWVGLVLILITGYSFKDLLTGELFPSSASFTENGEIVIKAASDGHFHIRAEVDGKPVHFMIDTGASDVFIDDDTARKIGINTGELDFSRIYNTANGQISAAPVTLKQIRIGDFVMENVPAAVGKSGLSSPLLGMSFLNRLRGFEVRGDEMALKP